MIDILSIAGHQRKLLSLISYGQEFLLYELTVALAIIFRVDYDQEKGMVT